MSRIPGRALACLLPMVLAAPVRAQVSLPSGFADEAIVQGLDQPNSFAFLPDGRVLLTEQRTGRVRMVVNGAIAASDPVLQLSEVNANGYERGLQGIAVDPGWPQRPYVYVYYTATDGHIRLERWTASGQLNVPDGQQLSLESPLVLIGDIPDLNADHNAGCLRFGPDGMLYVALGEDEMPCEAQDSTSLHGAILRLDVRGLPASGSSVTREALDPGDNPLATSDPNARLVYAYGLRNPWRFQPDPRGGKLYGVDVGEARFEEVNEMVPGGNYGWPYREGFFVQYQSSCPEPGGSGQAHYHDPILSWARPPGMTAVVSAGIYRRPGAGGWPAGYEGNVFYGEYYTGFLRRLVRSGMSWAPGAAVPGQPDPDDWATGLVAAVDFLEAADGSLWWLAQFDASMDGVTGSLHRIRWTQRDTTGTASAPPRALGTPNPFGAATEVSFDLPAATDVTLEIFDLSGRRVRKLFAGTLAPREPVAWDGRDDEGRDVRDGLYLVKLRGARIDLSLRLMRVR